MMHFSRTVTTRLNKSDLMRNWVLFHFSLSIGGEEAFELIIKANSEFKRKQINRPFRQLRKGDWGEGFVLVNGCHEASTNDRFPSTKTLVLNSRLKLRIFEKVVPKK